MRYVMLLWPHANVRYQVQARKLAQAELRLMLDRLAPDAAVSPCPDPQLPGLVVEFPNPPGPETLEALREHSLLYGLFEEREGLLAPVAGRAPARLGDDLPSILKYKGKTNEMFLQLLINAALYASDIWPERTRRLGLLDPMCGRATALFVAVNRGWDATGADVDRDDLKEAERYFKRYLEYHRLKHTFGRASRTLKHGGSAEERRFDFADGDGRPGALTLLNLDAAQSAEALGKNRYHIIVCDLPYGIRHDARLAPEARAKGNWLEGLLARALPGWRAALKPGGAIALSFNAQNLKLERLRRLMADAGFEVLRGGPYDGFSHWVEQAITRDIAVCRKPMS